MKDVCELIQYVTLRRSYNMRKPSWFSVSDECVSRVNVMILDGLTQSHFYRYFRLFTHLRSKYSTRWTLTPCSADLLTSDLFNAEPATLPDGAGTHTPLPAALMWHPVIRRFGLKRAGLSNFLLTQQEMTKHRFPAKGVCGCEGFVCTASGSVTDSSPLYGLDCEMCLTSAGQEVTRVALVDASGRCVLDELIKPLNPIINYCTEFSGVTRAMLSPVCTRLSDVQALLLQLLPPDAVLVGHSLDGDLRALHLIHPHVIDTSLLYRMDFGRRFKLKHLAQVILKREIQSAVCVGHDPCEDALAALHLAQFFIRKGPREVVQEYLQELWQQQLPNDEEQEISSDHQHSPQSFGHALFRSGQSALLLGRCTEIRDVLCAQMCRRQQCSSDREVMCVFRRVVQSYSVSVLLFSSFIHTLKQTTASGPQRHLQQVCAHLQQMCVLYVGPLPSDATERLVLKLLKRCGRLRSTRQLHYTHGAHMEVVFEHLEGAALALERLNGHQLSDCTIKVRRPVHEMSLDLDECVCERQQDRVCERFLYVCNLSCKAQRREQQLQSFTHFGTAAVHAGTRSRHAFIEFERADNAQAAVGVGHLTGSRKLWACPALTPPHMSSWTPADLPTTETSLNSQSGEECDERLLERRIRKLDRRVGKVYRALEGNCLSIVILPGSRVDGVDHLGLCFIHSKQM